MDEEEIQQRMVEAYTEWGINFVPDVENVMTFEGAGILTNNKGVVMEMKDGTEFQVTIVQSK